MCKFLLKKKKLFVAAYMIITLSMVCNLSVVRASQGSDGALTETDELLQELKELGVKRYGVQTGTIYDQDIMKLIPDAQLEYSEENENANVSILYGGDRLNITEMKDNLSMKVLKGVEKQIQYEWNPEEKRGNRISMIVC